MDATCEQFLKTYQQKVAMYEQGLDGGRQIKTVLEEKGLKAASRLD